MSSAQEQILVVPSGNVGLWEITVADANGAALSFSPSDTPSASVWSGDDQSVLFSPSIDWDSAPAGTLSLMISATQSALTPGTYRLAVNVLRASDSARLRVLDTWLSITESPGSATASPTYCTYNDLRDYGGGEWLEDLMKAEGQSNFARERARARSWLDGLIARKYRPWSSRHGSQISTITGPIDTPNVTISDKLADDLLIVDDGIKEVCVLKALELICRQRIGLDENNGFARKASYFRRMCGNRVACTVARVDPDEAGVPAFAIPLGITSIR